MKNLGKIDQTTLETIFPKKTGAYSNKVLQGPGFGIDTALIAIDNKKGMVVASDPLSIIPSIGMKASAWLSVHITANDIATAGYYPEFAQFVLNLPHDLGKESYLEYWDYIHQFCKEIGISITGGHTGFDTIGNSTIAGGATMFSIVPLDEVKSAANAQPKQSIIATKSAALSSTAILAKSFPNYIKSKLGEEVLKKAQGNFYSASVLPEIQALRQEPFLLPSISALHDITEGGILGAIYEFSEASKVGVEINAEAFKIEEEVKAICELFKINPLESIGTGSLLIVCNENMEQSIIQRLQENNLEASLIGKTTAYSNGKILHADKETKKIKHVTSAAYWTAYAKAIERNLN